jgi:hypothetical protein
MVIYWKQNLDKSPEGLALSKTGPEGEVLWIWIWADLLLQIRGPPIRQIANSTEE